MSAWFSLVQHSSKMEGWKYHMSKRMRQYLGILAALVSYYVIHEGAHFVYACSIGVFEKVRFLGLGVQIVTDAQCMTDTQLGLFCAVGAIATLIVAYALTLTAPAICKVESEVFKACMYYITMAMLLLDPLYLSALCGFFGGGDMNGIALLYPEWAARAFFGVLLVLNGILFWKVVLPKYRRAFAK